MAINFKPKVGQVLECNYGNYTVDEDKKIIFNFDFHIPNEMVKNRLVVVLNGRLGGCLVVPLSTTHDREKTANNIHVEVGMVAIPDLHYFAQQTRWAKADLIQQVSKERLNRPRRLDRGNAEICLDRALVEKIQRAVIKTIGAASLLHVEAPAGKQTP
jgi:uncharacterized protein YifN (PemK superfamily)